jgi:hypothetical protein
VAYLLQGFLPQQNDCVLRSVSHVDASRLIESAIAHRAGADFFRPSPTS